MHICFTCAKELQLEKHKKSGIIFSCAIKRLLQANVPSRLSDLKA